MFECECESVCVLFLFTTKRDTARHKSAGTIIYDYQTTMPYAMSYVLKIHD